MRKSITVGIDVSKATLDYTWTPKGIASQVTNDLKGIQKLIKKLIKLKPQIVVMEATGGYHYAIADALADAGIPYKVVNPRLIRDFARSLNRLAKTDKLDALNIAEYGAVNTLTPDRPRDLELRSISALLLRRKQLQQMITMEKGHLEQVRLAASGFEPELLGHIAVLNQSLNALNKAIRLLLESVPELAAMDAVMQSIPGIGPITSATIIAELPEIRALGRKQICALVGVAPFNRDSGKFRGQKHIHAGRDKVRGALYCALRPCLQNNAVVKAWFERFIAKGKPYKVAAIACIRKLLVVIRAMLLNNTTWNPEMHKIQI